MGSERKAIQEVNIELGDEISDMMYEAVRQSRSSRPGFQVASHDSFSGARSIPGSYFPHFNDQLFDMPMDGTGTKVEISERVDDHSAIAFDLFAMICDDAPVGGKEALGVSTTIDFRQVSNDETSRRRFKELAVGYVAAARAANVVIMNGEVAELGDRVGGYGAFNYNWCGSAWSVGHRDRELTGRELQPGHSLIGLAEEGFRSNGITDVRKILLEHAGPNWHDQVVASLGAVSLGRLVHQPSKIYSRLMAELTGGYDIERSAKVNVTGIAHITGGGQPSKLGRMLEASGLGAVIDEPLEPPAIMLELQRLAGWSDEKAYKKWHFGPGMVFATPQPEKALEEIRNFNSTVDMPLQAQRIGVVTEEPGTRIKNRGVCQLEEYLHF